MSNDRYKYNENENEEKDNKPNYRARRVLAIFVLACTFATGAFLAHKTKEYVEHVNNPYNYSGDTKTVVIPEGQGLNYAAYTIDGVDESVDVRRVVNHIEDMPENKESLADGVQENEGIVVPVSVEKNDN